MPPRRQQPSRKPISLGAALWGGRPAPGHYAPSQQAPDAWLRQMATQHKDALSGLLTSCRQGRDVALQIAAQVGLTLDCCDAPSEPTDAWLRRATSMQQALTTRGAQPTSLSVLCVPAPSPFYAPKLSVEESLRRVNPLPAYLKGAAGQAVTDLRLTMCQTLSGALWFKKLLDYCPNLVSLSLNTYPYPLPAPSHLPQLRQLSMRHGEDEPYERLRSCRSIAKYLPQLTTLSLDTCDDWTVIFKPSSTSHTLTSFTTESALTDELLTALLDHAPALTHLSVLEFSEDLDPYSDKEWQLEQLTVCYLPNDFYGEQMVLLDTLALLPRCKAEGGVVTVKCLRSTDEIMFCVVDEEGIATADPDALERLSQWRFDTRNIDIMRMCPVAVSDEEQLAMLTTLLEQLTSLRTAPGVPVRLRHWQWTEPMAQALARAMPTLRHLALGVCTKVTDESLGVMLQMGPHMRHLWVETMLRSDLQSDQYANTAWPWQELHWGYYIDIQHILSLPDPGLCDRIIRCRGVSFFSDDKLTQANADKLIDRLQHIVFSHQLFTDEGVDKPPMVKVQLKCNDTSDLPRQLSVLRAVRIQTPHPVHLRLIELKMGAGAVATLQGLPAWSCCLIFERCELPDDPAIMRKLGAALPPTYTYIELNPQNDSAKPKLLASFCKGLAERRAQARDAGEVMVHCLGTYAGDVVRVGKHVLWTSNGWLTMRYLYGD